MPKPVLSLLLSAAAVAAMLTTACSQSGSPSSPSSSTSSTTSAASSTPNTYVGSLSVGGGSDLGGSLQLTASSGLLSASNADRAMPGLARVIAWLEPRLHAQSGVPATGMLVTSSGSVVPLSGTYASSVFTVSGGGYSIVASVSGGSITGTGTAPGGLAAVVNAPAPAATAAPPPADPSGTYTGTFRIDAVQTFKNTFANGNVSTNCRFNIAITGTVVIDVQNKGNGQVYAHLTTTGQESETSRTCSFPFTGVGGTAGYDFQGSATNLQFGRAGSGSSGSGTVARTESFSGAIGVGEIVGTISRSFNFTTPTSTPGETHVEGYPTSSASVRLTRP